MSFLRVKDTLVIPYLDDLLIVGKDPLQCEQRLREVVVSLQSLGWLVNWEKSRLQPVKCQKFLGLLLDSADQICKLPEDKKISIVDKLSGSHTRVFSDNTTAVAYLKHQGGTRSDRLRQLASDIMELAEGHLLSLSAVHIRGTDNFRADFLSRHTLHQGEWMLNRKIFKMITAQWGIPQIDLFATRANRQVRMFASLNREDKPDILDALQVPWTFDLAYAFPPWNLLPLGKTKGAGVTKNTLSRWIREAIILAYKAGGKDPPIHRLYLSDQNSLWNESAGRQIRRAHCTCARHFARWRRPGKKTDGPREARNPQLKSTAFYLRIYRGFHAVFVRIPHVVLHLQIPIEEQMRAFQHGFSSNDCSRNVYIKKNGFTLHRNPIAQSTDGARTKIGFSEGRHAWEVWWEGPLGTVAVIGIATKRAPMQCQGYVALLGSDDQSWGWNLVDNNLLHNGEVNGSFPQCNNAPKYQIGERIRVILDMEDKTLAFERGYEFLGVAFRGLPKASLYPAVSAVYGNTEVTLVYLGKPLDG
ncbi:unnamed protein product [Ranitomeya imitator]|uniref:F-box/SPRY domain-containing protein 1 n=1 Tax=Ranitomeya imitator TaxID=111125 RepID=A0ABN9M2W1_9NEOB|nr:unnamed protein product [Ranitomeya imitator]